MEARAKHAAKGKRARPIVVKLSPDIAEDDLRDDRRAARRA